MDYHLTPFSHAWFKSFPIRRILSQTNPKDDPPIFLGENSSIVETHNRYIYIYEHTSRNTFHFRNNDPQGCVECINFDDKSIMAKYWPISSPWPFANYQRLLPLLRLSCCIMQFSLRFLLRLIPPNRTISSLYKYVGRDMIYSCTTIFVIGRCRVRRTKRESVVSGSRIPSSLCVLYTRWWTKPRFCRSASIDPLTWRNGAWISLWKLSKQ